VVTGYVKLTQPDEESFKLIGIDPFIEKPLHSGWQNEQKKMLPRIFNPINNRTE